MHRRDRLEPGSPWTLRHADGSRPTPARSWKSSPPRRLVIKWRNEWDAEMKAEGDALCTMEIEPSPTWRFRRQAEHHAFDRPRRIGFIRTVSGGWPRILANLKSLLETGSVVLNPVKRPA